jgi:hypothetical protein
MAIQAELWMKECDDLLVCLKEEILEDHLLARADSTKQFYLKTYWPKDGTGAVLLQS